MKSRVNRLFLFLLCGDLMFKKKINKYIYKNFFQAQKAARAKKLRAKFEKWEAEEVRREQSQSVNIVEEYGEDSQIESTKTLVCQCNILQLIFPNVNRSNIIVVITLLYVRQHGVCSSDSQEQIWWVLLYSKNQRKQCIQFKLTITHIFETEFVLIQRSVKSDLERISFFYVIGKLTLNVLDSSKQLLQVSNANYFSPVL